VHDALKARPILTVQGASDSPSPPVRRR
jgi:hypothetical protein